MWTLTLLYELEIGEHDFQEFKSSQWLVRNGSELSSDFPYLLSKQLSAFANAGGGQLFIGIDDSGMIDGGVSTQFRGGTREWLEDVIATSLVPSLNAFNVYEVGHSKSEYMHDQRNDQTKQYVHGTVKVDHAVYIIDIPASNDGPHQAKDRRYYMRVAGKTRQMAHAQLSERFMQLQMAQVELSRFDPYGQLEWHIEEEQRRALLMLRVGLINNGRRLARHVGLEITIPRPFAGKEVRRRMQLLNETHYTQRPNELSFFRYLPVPLFPSQEVYALCIWISLSEEVHSLALQDVIGWTIYADDAHPKQGRIPLTEFTSVRQALDLIKSK